MQIYVHMHVHMYISISCVHVYVLCMNVYAHTHAFTGVQGWRTQGDAARKRERGRDEKTPVDHADLQNAPNHGQVPYSCPRSMTLFWSPHCVLAQIVAQNVLTNIQYMHAPTNTNT